MNQQMFQLKQFTQKKNKSQNDIEIEIPTKPINPTSTLSWKI